MSGDDKRAAAAVLRGEALRKREAAGVSCPAGAGEALRLAWAHGGEALDEQAAQLEAVAGALEDEALDEACENEARAQWMAARFVEDEAF